MQKIFMNKNVIFKNLKSMRNDFGYKLVNQTAAHLLFKGIVIGHIYRLL